MKKILKRIFRSYQNLKDRRPGIVINVLLILLVLSITLNIFILSRRGKNVFLSANPVQIAIDSTDLSIGQKIFTYTDRQLGIKFKYRAAEQREGMAILIADDPSKGFLKEYLEVLTFDDQVQASLSYEIVTQSLQLAGRDAFILSSKDGDVDDAYVLVELPERVKTSAGTGWVVSIHLDRESLGPLISSFEFLR